METLELADRGDVSDAVVDADATQALKELIVELEEPDREIFFRKYFLFEPLGLIAQKVGLDQAQVKNRFYRGKRKLRKRLEERGISYEAN